jgi:hypothetical protein
MRKAEIVALLLVAGIAAGCKSKPLQIAGKWHGTTQLTATFTTPVSSTPRSESIPADFVLVLTQNGQTVEGEATVTGSKNAPHPYPNSHWRDHRRRKGLA